ncbi:zf-TFIIB domain-containing protein [uncultured Roseobacter sp.]|uniref:TFIIB-type zinc ribbon-containing protein n=1 Tax=uncultured Roseobacter sp. TaxID=114847 RepID=UPI00260E7145|nr:zf-TFIIB domain-containing protein [uncultured Roseobacter sp.]
MKCPVDGTTLVITDRSGVEIDYCPDCRGVWLDRGELDKIIDRSASAPPPPPQQRGYEDRGGYRKKKRGGFLEDIFDF